MLIFFFSCGPFVEMSPRLMDRFLTPTPTAKKAKKKKKKIFKKFQTIFVHELRIDKPTLYKCFLLRPENR